MLRSGIETTGHRFHAFLPELRTNDMIRCILAPLGHQFHVGGVVPLVEKRLLPTVAAPGKMVGQPRYHNSWYSRHSPELSAPDRSVDSFVLYLELDFV